MERARIELEAANLRNDAAARERALVALVKLDPEDTDAWRTLGGFAMNRHEYSQSVQAYQKALAAEPEDAGDWNSLAYAAAYAGDSSATVNALARYRTLRPADANPLDSLGDVNLLSGHLREAEGFYLEAARKDPAFLNGGDLFKAAIRRTISTGSMSMRTRCGGAAGRSMSCIMPVQRM